MVIPFCLFVFAVFVSVQVRRSFDQGTSSALKCAGKPDNDAKTRKRMGVVDGFFFFLKCRAPQHRKIRRKIQRWLGE
jgi:hypothetical protein